MEHLTVRRIFNNGIIYLVEPAQMRTPEQEEGTRKLRNRRLRILYTLAALTIIALAIPHYFTDHPGYLAGALAILPIASVATLVIQKAYNPEAFRNPAEEVGQLIDRTAPFIDADDIPEDHPLSYYQGRAKELETDLNAAIENPEHSGETTSALRGIVHAIENPGSPEGTASIIQEAFNRLATVTSIERGVRHAVNDFVNYQVAYSEVDSKYTEQ